MDKRYGLILIIFIVCIVNLFIVSDVSDVVGSASAECGDFIFSLPEGFTLYDSNPKHVLIRNSDGIEINVYSSIDSSDTYDAKIKEIESSIENIDSTWFEYNKIHKKHVLKIDVSFDTGKADIENIPLATREELYKAGKAIEKFLDKAQKEFGDTVKYLLIIEGQASNDGYSRNYELSYDRALSFFNYLKQNRNVDLRRDNCEVLICGSGTHGAMRAEPDNATNKNNQRFLIHVLPKPGIIE